MRDSMSRGIAVVALVLSLPALAESRSRFAVQTLGVDGDVLSVVPADLDGDGRKNLLVAFKRGVPRKEERLLAIFWNQGDSFSAKPDVELPAEADACAFDVGDIDGQPGAELLWVGARGVQMQSL